MPSPVLADPLDGHDHAAVVELDRQATCRLLPETRCRAAARTRQWASGQVGTSSKKIPGRATRPRPVRAVGPSGVSGAVTDPVAWRRHQASRQRRFSQTPLPPAAGVPAAEPDAAAWLRGAPSAAALSPPSTRPARIDRWAVQPSNARLRRSHDRRHPRSKQDPHKHHYQRSYSNHSGGCRHCGQCNKECDPLHAMQFRRLSPPQVRDVSRVQRPPRSDRGCPLDTAGYHCFWHAGGTAGENDDGRDGPRRGGAGLAHTGLTLVVLAGSGPPGIIRWR